MVYCMDYSFWQRKYPPKIGGISIITPRIPHKFVEKEFFTAKARKNAMENERFTTEAQRIREGKEVFY